MRRVKNNIRHHSNWLQYYFHKYFSPKGSDFTFRHRSGLDIAVPGRLIQTYKECFFDETYLKGMPDIPSLKAPQTVVDIGANVGYFSLSVFAENPQARVIAFEPIPVNFALLKSYQNQFPQLNFEVINQAVSGAPGTLTLNYDAADAYTTSASIFDRLNQKDQIEVKTTSLGELIQEYQLPKIDLLKLDCEGAEYDILMKAPASALDKVGMMVLETHKGKGENENQEALLKFLTQNGFSTNTYRNKVWAWK